MPDTFTIGLSSGNQTTATPGSDLATVRELVAGFVENHGESYVLKAFGGGPGNEGFWYPKSGKEAAEWLIDIITFHRYVDCWKRMLLFVKGQSYTYILVLFEETSVPAQAMEG